VWLHLHASYRACVFPTELMNHKCHVKETSWIFVSCCLFGVIVWTGSFQKYFVWAQLYFRTDRNNFTFSYSWTSISRLPVKSNSSDLEHFLISFGILYLQIIIQINRTLDMSNNSTFEQVANSFQEITELKSNKISKFKEDAIKNVLSAILTNISSLYLNR